MQSRNSTYSNTSKGLGSGATGIQQSAGTAQERKVAGGSASVASDQNTAAYNDYNRNSSMHKSGNQTQMMAMTHGFSSVNSGSSGAHHIRYQSQLQQNQNKLDMQNRMNMTI